MEPIRVAQVMGKMLFGGTESVVMNYYRHIDRTKVQFDFIADSDSMMPIPRKDEIERLGGRVFLVPPYQRLHEYIPALVRLFREQNYRIVHAHISTLNVFPLYAAKKAGVPVRISHSHTTAARGEWRKNILKYSLRPFAKTYATHYVACSKLAGEWLFGKKAMEQGKVTIFHNAIELDRYRYNEKVRNEVRKELGIGDDKFVIGHVGRFCYQKNQEFLLDVFAEVQKQNPDAVLMLVGDGKDRERIEEKARRLDLWEKVLLLGCRSDVERLYQAMDMFVLPSRYEGLPVVGVEAQAAGLPCILSDKMTKEARITDKTVLLELRLGADAWAKTITKRAEQKHANNVWTLICAGFSITTQCEQLLEFYVRMESVWNH